MTRYDPEGFLYRGAWVIILIIAVLSFALLAATKAKSESGMASYYWHGQRTASGERFNPDAMTAAHKSLPFGVIVTVLNVSNNRSVKVRINDRGPFIKGRIIDLSRAAAHVLGMIDMGVAKVRITVD